MTITIINILIITLLLLYYIIILKPILNKKTQELDTTILQLKNSDDIFKKIADTYDNKSLIYSMKLNRINNEEDNFEKYKTIKNYSYKDSTNFKYTTTENNNMCMCGCGNRYDQPFDLRNNCDFKQPQILIKKFNEFLDLSNLIDIDYYIITVNEVDYTLHTDDLNALIKNDKKITANVLQELSLLRFIRRNVIL